jgi:DNA repair exonuclease SbcCD ATPase subunit
MSNPITPTPHINWAPVSDEFYASFNSTEDHKVNVDDLPPVPLEFVSVNIPVPTNPVELERAKQFLQQYGIDANLFFEQLNTELLPIKRKLLSVFHLINSFSAQICKKQEMLRTLLTRAQDLPPREELEAQFQKQEAHCATLEGKLKNLEEQYQKQKEELAEVSKRFEELREKIKGCNQKHKKQELSKKFREAQQKKSALQTGCDQTLTEIESQRKLLEATRFRRSEVVEKLDKASQILAIQESIHADQTELKKHQAVSDNLVQSFTIRETRFIQSLADGNIDHYYVVQNSLKILWMHMT